MHPPEKQKRRNKSNPRKAGLCAQYGKARMLSMQTKYTAIPTYAFHLLNLVALLPQCEPAAAIARRTMLAYGFNSCKTHPFFKTLSCSLVQNQQSSRRTTRQVVFFGRGIYFRMCFRCLFVFFAFGFLASWLLGFLASWLFGFSASGLFGFLALAFRILCIPSSSSPGGILAFAAFGGFSFLHPYFPSSCPGFLAFTHFYWFLNMISHIINIM